MATKIVQTKTGGFQEILERKEAELVRAFRERDGIVIEKSADQMDAVQYASASELAIRNADRESILLRRVRAALRRIHEGSLEPAMSAPGRSRGDCASAEGNTMRDAHQKAAGQHESAAHAHRPAAEHDEKGNHVAGSWQSERAPKHRIMLGLVVVANFAALSLPAQAQALPDSGNSSQTVASTTPAQPNLAYTRPTQKIKLYNYLFDAFGPYPFVGAALAAGINQASNSPPEWKQGAAAYGKRFGSNLGIAAVTMTTRYALAEAFKDDSMYYRCECTGVGPRLKHAVVSTLTARRGADGHRVFSIPALVAPYVGTMTAVYAWYPSRYAAKDAFRLGNFNMLAYVGGNIALEFLYGGPHSLLSRMHLDNRHGAPNPDSKP